MEGTPAFEDAQLRICDLVDGIKHSVITPLHILADILRNSAEKGFVIKADEYGEVLKLFADGATYRLQQLFGEAHEGPVEKVAPIVAQEAPNAEK